MSLFETRAALWVLGGLVNGGTAEVGRACLLVHPDSVGFPCVFLRSTNGHTGHLMPIFLSSQSANSPEIRMEARKDRDIENEFSFFTSRVYSLSDIGRPRL